MTMDFRALLGTRVPRHDVVTPFTQGAEVALRGAALDQQAQQFDIEQVLGAGRFAGRMAAVKTEPRRAVERAEGLAEVGRKSVRQRLEDDMKFLTDSFVAEGMDPQQAEVEARKRITARLTGDFSVQEAQRQGVEESKARESALGAEAAATTQRVEEAKDTAQIRKSLLNLEESMSAMRAKGMGIDLSRMEEVRNLEKQFNLLPTQMEEKIRLLKGSLTEEDKAAAQLFAPRVQLLTNMARMVAEDKARTLAGLAKAMESPAVAQNPQLLREYQSMVEEVMGDRALGNILQQMQVLNARMERVSGGAALETPTGEEEDLTAALVQMRQLFAAEAEGKITMDQILGARTPEQRQALFDSLQPKVEEKKAEVAPETQQPTKIDEAPPEISIEQQLPPEMLLELADLGTTRAELESYLNVGVPVAAAIEAIKNKMSPQEALQKHRASTASTLR